MKTSLLIAIATIITITNQLQLPIDFRSSRHPNSLLINFQVQPNQVLRLRSTELVPGGNYWTTITSQAQRLNFNPPLDSKELIFNEKHQGKYVANFYAELQGSSNKNKHFHHVEADIEGQSYHFLLPLFSHQLPEVRSDKLFRCDHTLVAVEWIGNDAHVIAFGRVEHQWNILKNIDDGYAGEDEGIRYAYAIDKNHKSPIIVDISGGRYCSISQDSQPAVIKQSWTKSFYNLNNIMDLVGQGEQILQKKGPSVEQL